MIPFCQNLIIVFKKNPIYFIVSLLSNLLSIIGVIYMIVVDISLHEEKTINIDSIKLDKPIEYSSEDIYDYSDIGKIRNNLISKSYQDKCTFNGNNIDILWLNCTIKNIHLIDTIRSMSLNESYIVNDIDNTIGKHFHSDKEYDRMMPDDQFFIKKCNRVLLENFFDKYIKLRFPFQIITVNNIPFYYFDKNIPNLKGYESITVNLTGGGIDGIENYDTFKLKVKGTKGVDNSNGVVSIQLHGDDGMVYLEPKTALSNMFINNKINGNNDYYLKPPENDETIEYTLSPHTNKTKPLHIDSIVLIIKSNAIFKELTLSNIKLVRNGAHTRIWLTIIGIVIGSISFNNIILVYVAYRRKRPIYPRPKDKTLPNVP